MPGCGRLSQKISLAAFHLLPPGSPRKPAMNLDCWNGGVTHWIDEPALDDPAASHNLVAVVKNG